MLLVAHDVNPLLGLPGPRRLPRAAAGRWRARSSEVISAAHAQRAVRHRRSRSCAPPTAAWSWSGSPRRPTITATATALSADDPTLSPDLIADVRELLTFPFMVNALEAGTIVAVLAARGRLVRGPAPPGVRLAHAVGDGVPGRRGRRAGRAADLAGLLRGVRGRGAGDRAAGEGGQAQPRRGQRRDGGHRHRADGRAGRRLSVPVAQPVACSAVPRRCCSAPSSGSPAARCSSCCWSRWWRSAALAVIARPLLFASVDREVARAGGVPVGAARRRVPAHAGAGDRRHQPAHRRAAGLRAAGGAARRARSRSPCARSRGWR